MSNESMSKNEETKNYTYLPEKSFFQQKHQEQETHTPEKKISEPNKFKKLKETFSKWSEDVDVNCYNKMLKYGPNLKVQFIWLIILLGSTGATFYFIAKSIIGYLDYNVVSQTNIVYEIPTQFPTVTFCDNNPFSTEAGESFMQMVALENQILLNSTDLSLLAQLKATSHLTSENDRKTLGFNIDQILSCSYINTDCRYDLHWFWSFTNGNCYQFNAGLNLSNQNKELKITFNKGSAFGLSIQLVLKLNMNKYSRSLADGVIVFVHNSSFRPDQGVYVEPGKLTDIQVERTFIQKQPQPYSECNDLTKYTSELYDYIKKSGQKYRQQDCFELCLQKLILANCKCYFPGFQNLSTLLGPCLNLTQSYCCGNQYYNFNLNDCQALCPLECDTIKYGLTLSSLVYPSKAFYDNMVNTPESSKYYESLVNETLTVDSLKAHVVYFNVYYPNLQYALITETPQTSVSDLFSQIGGSLGLFVSFSIFTLFELVEIFILVIYTVFFKNISAKVSSN